MTVLWWASIIAFWSQTVRYCSKIITVPHIHPPDSISPQPWQHTNMAHEDSTSQHSTSLPRSLSPDYWFNAPVSNLLPLLQSLYIRFVFLTMLWSVVVLPLIAKPFCLLLMMLLWSVHFTKRQYHWNAGLLIILFTFKSINIFSICLDTLKYTVN